jgi:hypothetical protein
MIGAARVMAAVQAPRMDAVRIKRGISPSILSVAPTIPEEVRQREGASEHGTALRHDFGFHGRPRRVIDNPCRTYSIPTL